VPLLEARIKRIDDAPCVHKTFCYRLIAPPPFEWIQEQGVFQACKLNELVALEKRHLLNEGEPDPVTWRRCMHSALELTCELSMVRVATPDEVVAHKSTPAARRRYAEAFTRNREEGWPATLQRVSAFVKVEKWEEGVMKKKAPRLIQYRSFRYCAELSTYLLPVEEALWNYEDPTSGLKPFAKQMNSFQIADTIVRMADQFDNPIFVMADHSKFDSCVTAPWIALEENFYTAVTGSQQELSELMQMQYFNRGYTKGGVQYLCKARKMSGEYNTSLGDTLINWCILQDVFRGVRHVKLLNGDDSVICLETADFLGMDLGPHVWRAYGFKTNFEVTKHIEQVEFCQSRPVQIREAVWRMVRSPKRAISRSIVAVKRYEGRAWLALCAAIGQSELACGDGVPMIQSFAQMMVRAACGVPPLPREMSRRAKLEAIQTPNARPVTDVARLSFEAAFEFTPQEQIEFENWCDDQTPTVLPFIEPDDRCPVL
jgi:hypothetical protein